VGAFPLDSDQFNKMADSIEKLALNDRSLSVQRESSTALGQGIASDAEADFRFSNGVSGVSSCGYHRGQIASGIWLRGT
jgi:hypothetical protein